MNPEHKAKIYNSDIIILIICAIGAVSDGEFNSLRTQGSTRPLHIWQIIHDVKESVSRQNARTLRAMLEKIGGQS